MGLCHTSHNFTCTRYFIQVCLNTPVCETHDTKKSEHCCNLQHNALHVHIIRPQSVICHTCDMRMSQAMLKGGNGHAFWKFVGITLKHVSSSLFPISVGSMFTSFFHFILSRIPCS